jgi:hypothetical protein
VAEVVGGVIAVILGISFLVRNSFKAEVKQMNSSRKIKFSPGIILVILFCTFITNCESKQYENQAEEIRTEKETKEFMYREDSVLLSLAYDIPNEKIFNLIIDWEKARIDKRLSLDKTDSIMILINSLSEKYNIPKHTLAKILLDYKKIGK